MIFTGSSSSEQIIVEVTIHVLQHLGIYWSLVTMASDVLILYDKNVGSCGHSGCQVTLFECLKHI